MYMWLEMKLLSLPSPDACPAVSVCTPVDTWRAFSESWRERSSRMRYFLHLSSLYIHTKTHTHTHTHPPPPPKTPPPPTPTHTHTHTHTHSLTHTLTHAHTLT